jgi:phage terminase large subunit-like protein
MRPRISMREALAEPELLGHVLQGSSWYGWRILLIAAAGEELTDDEREEFRRLTGREREPGHLVHELVAIAGRRAGKSTAMAVFCIWVATLCDHRGVLAPGEVGVCLLVSRDQRVSRMLVDRISGIMEHSEPLSSMIGNRTQDTIELTNGISIEVRPASFRTLRGPTYVAVLADEIAFWHTATDYANPDVEILAAARPGLLTTRGPLLRRIV